VIDLQNDDKNCPIFPVISVTNLNISLGSETVLKDITFEINKGDYCAVIGPNGGGKTTLMRAVLGLQKFDSGSIALFGKKLSSFKEWRKIGYVPQRASHVDSEFPATVREVVCMGRSSGYSLFWRKKSEDEEAVENAMQIMEVKNLENRRIGELSGGQRQRAMIARALVSHPEVLVLDEPNTGVDMAVQQKFYALLRELNQKHNITIILITHDIGVVADDIKSIFRVNQTLLANDAPHEVLSCDDMSELYGIHAHMVDGHRHD